MNKKPIDPSKIAHAEDFYGEEILNYNPETLANKTGDDYTNLDDLGDEHIPKEETQVEYTMALRWNKGVLEQKIITYTILFWVDGTSKVKHRAEIWTPVPEHKEVLDESKAT